MRPIRARRVVRRPSHAPVVANGAPYRKVKPIGQRVLGRRVLGPWRQAEALDRLTMTLDEWGRGFACGEWVSWPPPGETVRVGVGPAGGPLTDMGTFRVTPHDGASRAKRVSADLIWGDYVNERGTRVRVPASLGDADRRDLIDGRKTLTCDGRLVARPDPQPSAPT